MSIDIREYVPRGHKNAINRANLKHRVGVNDRELRMMIEKANLEEDKPPIINLSDGKGYFIPLESEDDLLNQYIRSEISRSRKLEEKIRVLKRNRENKYQFKMEDVFI